MKTNSDAIVRAVDDEVQLHAKQFTHARRKALIIKTVLHAAQAVAKNHGMTLADIEDIDGFLSMPYVPLETNDVAG